MSEQIKLSKSSKDENKSTNVVKVSNQSSKRKYSERTANKRNKLNICNAKSKIKDEVFSHSYEDFYGNASINVSKKIDSSLPEPLNKNRPMSFQEKSILPYVIANEYVLSMVHNTMKLELSPEEELSHITIEPIFTRSKAKEKSKKQCLPPWPVSLPARSLQKIYRPISKCAEKVSDQSNSDADIKSNAAEYQNSDDRAESYVCLTSNETNENEELSGLKLSSGESETEVPGQDINDDCDSEIWHHFVSKSVKPIDSTLIPDHSDDVENDPDFKVIEEDMSDSDEFLSEDLPIPSTSGQATKLVQKEKKIKFHQVKQKFGDELNGLVAETFELALHATNEEKDEVKTPNSNSEEFHTEINIVPTSVSNLLLTGLTSDERLQLDEQLRMHVQLLSQSYMLSYGNGSLNYITVSTKVLLDQIKMYAMHERTNRDASAFYAQNLDGAVAIVNEFENLNLPIPSQILTQPKKKLPVLPPHIKKTLATNKVFIYPELLPSCGFRNNVDVCKFFCTPEDNLISLGLERFSKLTNPVEHIHNFILPAKSVEQIKLRIKNSKSKKIPLTNPIKFYCTYNQAPQFPRVVRIFDPDNVKVPEDYSPDFLPKWMEPYSKLSKPHSINPVLAPSQTLKPSIKVTVHRKCHKPLESKKYNPILPRGMHFSPLKQISPILKKYSQQRRTVPIVSFSINSPHKKSPFKTLKPKPTSINSNADLESNVISSNTQQPSTNSSNKDVQTASTTCKTVQEADNESYSTTKDKFSNVENKDNCVEETPLSTEKEDKVCELSTVTKSPKVNAAETEVSDEVDEEVLEDEQESTAAVVATAATTGKKHSISKKRNRHQRDLEASLALLQPTVVKGDPMKEEREVMFANSYLLRATEILKGNPEVYEQFLSTLSKYHLSTGSPVELYSELKEILKDYPTLVRDFVVFLNPGQAKECGRYKEYIALSKIREFFRKIELHFKNQPQHNSRILRTFSQLHQQAEITSTEVINALQPLLRNQTHLMEELNHLLPDVSPPEYLMTDFEDVTMPNSDDDDSSIDTCEEIIIPDTPDPYGGKDCPCDCHKSTTDNRLLNKIRHCVKCGVKFIDGRIYIQTGKVLKPAQVIYHDPPLKSSKTEKLHSQQTQSKAHQSSEAASKSHPDPDASSKTTLSKSQQATDTAIKTAHTKAQVSATALKCGPLPEKGCKSDVDHQKIEDSKVSENVQREVHGPSIPSSSKLPCDVLEDAVFPTGGTSSLNKSSPSDFSQIRDMIGSSKKDSDSTDTNNQPAVSRQNVKWTRDEDKLIIYNCQRFGITKKAIFATANAMKTRTAQEVLNRFVHLMVFLSKVIKKQ